MSQKNSLAQEKTWNNACNTQLLSKWQVLQVSLLTSAFRTFEIFVQCLILSLSVFLNLCNETVSDDVFPVTLSKLSKNDNIFYIHL